MKYRVLCANGHLVDPCAVCPQCGAAVASLAISGDPEATLATPVDPEATVAASEDAEATLSVGGEPGGDSVPPTADPGADRIEARGSRGFILGTLAGRGGLGEVYKAVDEALGRTVALKRVGIGVVQTPAVVRRFVDESRITARLEHPGIVPVHSLGYDDNGPFYTMKFITGNTLHEAVKNHFAASEQLNRELLRRFIGVCQAVSLAHSQKVIHRDIKPANIMLGEYGETILLDWGLAKELSAPEESDSPSAAAPDFGDPTLTVAGQRLGTPHFMPPEQESGAVQNHTRASDIYSLGAVLFFILTGKPPPGANGGGSIAAPVPAPELAANARAPEIASADRWSASADAPTRERIRHVPAALRAVVNKAMAQAQPDRYASAQKLAQDVQRWLDDEPVSVYRDSLAVRVGRWLRRHRTFAMACAIIVTLGIAAVGVNSVMVRREQRRTAAQEKLTRLELARSELAEGDALAIAGTPLQSLERIQAADELFHGLSAADDKAVLAALAVVWQVGTPSLSAIDIGPRFRDAAIYQGRNEALTVGDDGILRSVNLLTSAVTPWPNPEPGMMTAIGISPLRDLLALGNADGSVWLGHLSDRQAVWPAPVAAHGQVVRSLQFSPDGSVFASLGKDGSVWLWRAQPEGAGVQVELPGGARATAIAFGGNARLVVASANGFRTFDVSIPRPKPLAGGSAGNLTAIAANDEATIVVAGDSRGVIHRWKNDVAEPELALAVGSIHRLLLSPDGQTVWITAEDGRSSQLNLSRGQVLKTLSPQPGSPLQFLDVDWQRGLAITVRKAGVNWRLEAWNLRGNAVATVLANSQDVGGSMAFSSAGSLLTGVRRGGQVAMWDLDTGLELLPRATLPAGGATLLSADGKVACFSTDSFLTVNPSDSRTVDVLATQDGRSLGHLSESVSGAQFRVLSPDGTNAATVTAVEPGRRWTLGLWEIANAGRGPEASVILAGSPSVGAYSADGRTLAIGMENGRILIYDLQQGLSHEVGNDSVAVRQLCFIPGTQEIVAGYLNGTLRTWSAVDFSNGRTVTTAHLGDITGVVAAKDADLIFSTGRDGRLRAWNKNLEPLRDFRIDPSFELLGLSPTGECLVFRDRAGLTALHLDFARRLLQMNLRAGGSATEKLPERYLALGRPDWFLRALPGTTRQDISQADEARAFWIEGRISEARAAFSRAAETQPFDVADLRECLRKLQSMGP